MSDALIIIAIGVVFCTRRYRKSSSNAAQKKVLLAVEIAAIIVVIAQFPLIHNFVEKVSHPSSSESTLSEAETTNIMVSILKCWGEEDSNLPVVNIDVLVNPDTSIQSIHVIDAEKERYNSDLIYRQTADRAMNALKACSPLTFLPKGKYEIWKELALTFDPKMDH